MTIAIGNQQPFLTVTNHEGYREGLQEAAPAMTKKKNSKRVRWQDGWQDSSSSPSFHRHCSNSNNNSFEQKVRELEDLRCRILEVASVEVACLDALDQMDRHRRLLQEEEPLCPVQFEQAQLLRKTKSLHDKRYRWTLIYRENHPGSQRVLPPLFPPSLWTHMERKTLHPQDE